MRQLDRINPTLPEPKTRDGVLDAFINAIRDRIKEILKHTTSESLEELPILVHALVETKGAKRNNYEEVKARIKALQAIPSTDEQVHLRDASLGILKKIKIAIDK